MWLMEEACWWMENIWCVFGFRRDIELDYLHLYVSITDSDLLAWGVNTKVMWGWGILVCWEQQKTPKTVIKLEQMPVWEIKSSLLLMCVFVSVTVYIGACVVWFFFAFVRMCVWFCVCLWQCVQRCEIACVHVIVYIHAYARETVCVYLIACVCVIVRVCMSACTCVNFPRSL